LPRYYLRYDALLVACTGREPRDIGIFGPAFLSAERALVEYERSFTLAPSDPMSYHRRSTADSHLSTSFDFLKDTMKALAREIFRSGEDALGFDAMQLPVEDRGIEELRTG
jgi:hypothetical protein